MFKAPLQEDPVSSLTPAAALKVRFHCTFIRLLIHLRRKIDNFINMFSFCYYSYEYEKETLGVDPAREHLPALGR